MEIALCRKISSTSFYPKFYPEALYRSSIRHAAGYQLVRGRVSPIDPCRARNRGRWRVWPGTATLPGVVPLCQVTGLYSPPPFASG
jgi:hypothetical protein